MTEKIARRGVKTPASFEPDILQQLTIAAVMSQKCIAINKEISIQEVRLWIKQQKLFTTPGFIVVSAMEEPEGIINTAEVLAFTGEPSSFIETIMHRVIHPLRPDDNLQKAVQQLTQTKLAMLPVIGNDNKLAGFVTAQSILEAYQFRQNEHYHFTSVLSLKRSSLRILVRGQQIIRSGRRKPNKEQHREA